MVVGHDWGGSVAWSLAMNHPEVVDRLVILNAAHPRRLNERLKHPRQLLRSWYFFYFQFPGLAEHRARRRHWRFFKRFLRDARSPFTDYQLDRYVEAWSRPGAAKSMIDYYRAAVRLGSKQEIRTVSAPTLVIWGQGDRYLGRKLAEPHHEDVPNLDRVERLPDASHWVHPRRGRTCERTAHRLLRPGGIDTKAGAGVKRHISASGEGAIRDDVTARMIENDVSFSVLTTPAGSRPECTGAARLASTTVEHGAAPLFAPLEGRASSRKTGHGCCLRSAEGGSARVRTADSRAIQERPPCR